TATMTITVTVTKAGAIVNTATVTGNETDPSTANNTASVSVTVQGPKLALTKQVQGGALKVGTNFTYTLTLKNSGPGSTTAATISAPLRAGQTYVSSTGTQGSCVNASGTVTCTIGTLALNQTVTVTITVKPTVKGKVTNTATASSNEATAVTASA